MVKRIALLAPVLSVLVFGALTIANTVPSSATPSGCPSAGRGAEHANANSRHGRCSTPTPAPTPASTPTGSPTPSPTPGLLVTEVTLTNDTTQVANDLHVVVTASNLNPIQQNAPGCDAPTFNYGPGLPAYTYIDIYWPTSCVDPGESVTLWFSPDCIPCAAPIVTSCSWSVNAVLIGGCTVPPTPTPPSPTPSPPQTPTPTPTPTPMPGPTVTFGFTNNTGTTANDLHFFAEGNGLQVDAVASPAGCGTPGVEVIGYTSIEPIYHVTLTWPEPCVDDGESVSVDLSCPGSCTPTLFDGCADWTLNGRVIGTRCPFPPTPTARPSPTP